MKFQVGSAMLGAFRVTMAAIVLLIISSAYRSCARLGERRARETVMQAPVLPGGRSEGEFGPIFAQIQEADERAHRQAQERFGDNFDNDANPDAVVPWERNRGLYLDEMIYRQYSDLSKLTGYSLDELLDIRSEGAARGWYVPPKKRSSLTPAEVEKRLKINRESSFFLKKMFAEKAERDRMAGKKAVD